MAQNTVLVAENTKYKCELVSFVMSMLLCGLVTDL